MRGFCEIGRKEEVFTVYRILFTLVIMLAISRHCVAFTNTATTSLSCSNLIARSISTTRIRCETANNEGTAKSGKFFLSCFLGLGFIDKEYILCVGRASAAVVQAATSTSSSKPTVEITLQPPKGTRDFYPEEKRLQNWLFGIWKNVASKYGFEEYDAPVVEHVELYIRKAGEEVTQQLYDFQDKGGRHLSLRPEMTPSLARMVLAKKGSLSFPLKWFAIPQCWRYESMTRGRRRYNIYL